MPGTAKSGGRNRKSAAEHALTGSGRADRGTLASSTGGELPPDPPKGRPPIPVGLIGPALEEWTRMVARLEQAQTLTVVDDAALYQYCCMFAETEAIAVAQRGTVALLVTLQAAIDRWNRLVDRLEAAENAKTLSADAFAQSVLERGAYGNRIFDATEQIVQLKKLEAKYPTQLRQGHMALRQYLVEFGMTPAARSRVQPSPDAPTPASPIDRFTKPRP
jgi:phage terminase small subunit